MNLTKDIDLKKFTIIESTEEKILTAQDYLNIAEEIIKNHSRCVLIIDSYSCLSHERENTDGVGTAMMGGGNQLLAQFCRQMANVVPVKNNIVIGIVHLMVNISKYGTGMVEKGGGAIQYQVDVKLRCKSSKEWLISDKSVGREIEWVAECNALGALPNQECINYFRYGKGIDEVKELITLAVSLNIIKKSGAWFTSEHWTEKSHGEENLHKLILNKPEYFEIVKKEVGTFLESL